MSPTSSEYAARAAAVIPGFQSNLRAPLIGQSFCFVKGRGARLWDADGQEYIDYIIASGAAVLGHSNQAYLDAVKDQLETLYYSFCGGSWTPPEIELAEKMIGHVPCADKVRFLLSGTEAVQLIIRLARGFTGRRIFLRFEGHYHGWMDNVLGGGVDLRLGERPYPVMVDDMRNTAGRDSAAFEQSFLIPWNDAQVLEETFKQFGAEIALVHMEPILVNGGCCPPRPGYLETVRRLCNDYGALLSFDEVITGFRVGLGGAQGLFGVTPDLASYGKAFAGGLPVSAVAGRAEVMNQLLDHQVIGAGTLNGYPLGMAAALATMKILEQDDGAFYRLIEERQTQLRQGLAELSRAKGIPLLLQGPTGAQGLLFTEMEAVYDVRQAQQTDMKRLQEFSEAMIKQGILMAGGRMYPSGGLTEDDVSRTLDCAVKAFEKLN